MLRDGSDTMGVNTCILCMLRCGLSQQLSGLAKRILFPKVASTHS